MASENQSTGITDKATINAHEVIHNAEQKQHEVEAEQQHGLPDSAVDAEREGMNAAESQNTKTSTGQKVKDTLNEVIPGNK